MTQNLFWELQIVPKSRKHMVGNYKKQYWRKQRSLNLEKIFFFFKFSQNFIFCSQVHQRIHLENLNLAKIDPKLILRVANCSKVQKTHGWKLQKAILKKTALTKSWKNFLFFKFSQNFIFCSQVHQRIHLENLNLAKTWPKTYFESCKLFQSPENTWLEITKSNIEENSAH